MGTSLLVVVNASKTLVTLCASSESAAVISWSNGILEMSIPVQPLKRTRPPTIEAYLASSSYLADASSSVGAIIGVKVAKNLMDCGSRPFSAARRRMLPTLDRSRAGE